MDGAPLISWLFIPKTPVKKPSGAYESSAINLVDVAVLDQDKYNCYERQGQNSRALLHTLVHVAQRCSGFNYTRLLLFQRQKTFQLLHVSF